MTRFTKTIAAFATAITLGLGIAASSSTPAAWGGVGIALSARSALAATLTGGGCYVTREPVRDVYGPLPLHAPRAGLRLIKPGLAGSSSPLLLPLK